jgi:hypothetical protein
VDPEDHHLFASIGRATENVIRAALANGLNGNALFDAARGGTLAYHALASSAGFVFSAE